MNKKLIGRLLLLVGAVFITAGGLLFSGYIRSFWGLFGFDGAKTYLVLLQNHYELRPTGGFMGSYGLITFEKGKIREIEVQDIYEPDGKVTEHINSPEPIQTAFQLGTWRLRDANWDPDFSKSAGRIKWFMGKAGITDIDGIISVNLMVLEKMMEILGPMDMIEYGETVSAENLWEKTQHYAQDNYFPGSKQKKEFLGNLAATLKRKYADAGWIKKTATVKLAVEMLNQKQIMANFDDSKLEELINFFDWDGRAKTARCPWRRRNCVKDYFFMVEANLGVNKANRGMERKIILEITREKNILRHRLVLKIKNNSEKEKWGGDYLAWMRIYAPGRQDERGFWVEAAPGEEKMYELAYFLPLADDSGGISLMIQKQSGVEKIPIEIKYVNRGQTRTQSFNLERDTQVNLR